MPQLQRRAGLSSAPGARRPVNYRHSYHAGNFADVVKHIALVSVLEHLKKKATPFCVIDTHAGRGLYDLTGAEAARTGEAGEGIARFADMDSAPGAVGTWLTCVRREAEGCYPGSPRLIARLLRPQDRLLAIEKHPEEVEALVGALAPFANAKALGASGYERLTSLLPPSERRGLILIDPPYEAGNEFMRAADLLAAGHRRFATGIFLLWFPLKSKADADSLTGEIRARGVSRALRLDIERDAGGSGRLAAAGLLVVNPPYGFDQEMRAAGDILSKRLGRPGRPATISIADA